MPEIQDPIYNCIQVKTPDVQDQVQRRYIPILITGQMILECVE